MVKEGKSMHGGDIYRNKIAYDFSVNVNPLGVPGEVMKAMENALSQVSVYPDAKCDALRESIAGYHSVSWGKPFAKDRIVCGNGASELLHAVCRWRKGEWRKTSGRNERPKALLIMPCFSGYEQALSAEDYEIVFTGKDLLFECLEREQPQILFFTNPDNPTGYLEKKEYLLKLKETCRRLETTLVVDECFLELTDSRTQTMIPYLEDAYMFVLRAFTKSLAIPGVRLGYLLCGDSNIAWNVKNKLPEWNVSVPAQAAGIAAVKVLMETDYRKRTLELLQKERLYLKDSLESLGLQVYESSANYFLFKKNKQWDIDFYTALLEKEILIRDCSDYKGLGEGYYRIAVKTHKENEVIVETVKQILQEYKGVGNGTD